jgi:tagatose-6-phosphate ketose/aldose isomerase
VNDTWTPTEAPAWAPLLAPSEAERVSRGYGHTLREILQQPDTWRATARQLAAERDRIEQALAPAGSGGGGFVVLTGSGSSLYAAECAALALQEARGGLVQALPAGLLLTHTAPLLPADRPFVLVSMARSGNSPESGAVVDLLLEGRPLCRHLILTCNGDGRLATRYSGHPRVAVVVLDPRTNDQSLVMTSSFTNLALAGASLGRVSEGAGLQRRAHALAEAGGEVLATRGEAIARLARTQFRSVVYLGSGAAHGAARESALKMLEMTSGRVATFAESFLGLRHGPLSALHPSTLVAAFLSPNPRVNAYELDLLRQIDRKGLGAGRLLVGDGIPAELVRPGDVALSPAGFSELAEDEAALVSVVAGQLLAFFCCLALEARPDTPSPSGVIQRVVEEFAIYK